MDGAQAPVLGDLGDVEPDHDGLVARGHTLRSRCDTEVLPHLYEEHGADLGQHLRGMFAFAAWDRDERRGVLYRDRLGIKPLYYAIVDGLVVFGSELKCILASGLVGEIRMRAQPGAPALSERERQVLQAFARGASIPQVAGLLLPTDVGWISLGLAGMINQMVSTVFIGASTTLLYLALRVRREGMDLAWAADSALPA